MVRYVILMMFLMSVFMAGCEVDANQSVKQEQAIEIDKLEIFHFHGTNQCYSCVTVGDFAEATVNEYFSDELESGKIVFAHINAELAENSLLVKKYGVTGSSLWFGIYKGDLFEPEQNVLVWYKINNKQAYMDYLKSEIEKKLTGS